MAAEIIEPKVPKRILNTLLSSLTAGVVPRSGAPYIAIGRRDEINTLLDNLDDIKDGGAACRFLIGRYGSGKSFLIQLIRGYALDRGFICADADLSSERRLSGGNGAGIATYRELITNMAIKASPDGGALPTILSRHFTKLRTDCTMSYISKRAITVPSSPTNGSRRRRRPGGGRWTSRSPWCAVPSARACAAGGRTGGSCWVATARSRRLNSWSQSALELPKRRRLSKAPAGRLRRLRCSRLPATTSPPAAARPTPSTWPRP